MGRRPIAKDLPYGTTSVFQLGGSVEKRTAQSAKKHKDKAERVQVKTPIRRTRTLYGRSVLKSECSRSSSLTENAALAPCPIRSLRAPGLESKHMDYVLRTGDGFFDVHRTFLLGRTFVDDFQNAVRKLFRRSPQLLVDSYSVAMKLMQSRHETSPSVDVNDISSMARCLVTLTATSCPVASVEDAAMRLLLGQALLVSNVLLPSFATHSITRGALLNVKDWYPALIQQPCFDAITLTPVLIDLVECLVRREMPVIRLPDVDRYVVDRFLGITTTLLPLLYDLCESSYHVKEIGFAIGGLLHCDGDNDVYSKVERNIYNWAPDIPSEFFTRYSAWEVTVMLAQARTYRLAALLAIHRLRRPLVQEDHIAERFADEILRDLSILKTWPPDAATGVGFDFPLLVATLEMPERGRELYEAFEPFRFRRQHSDELLEFIDMVIAARESGYDGLWFDLVHDRLRGITMT